MVALIFISFHSTCILDVSGCYSESCGGTNLRIINSIFVINSIDTILNLLFGRSFKAFREIDRWTQ